MMEYDNIQTPEDAMSYLCECAFASVEEMAMRKRRPKYEYERIIKIGQRAYDLMFRFAPSQIQRGRGKSILEHKGNVSEWAKSMEVK